MVIPMIHAVASSMYAARWEPVPTKNSQRILPSPRGSTPCVVSGPFPESRCPDFGVASTPFVILVSCLTSGLCFLTWRWWRHLLTCLCEALWDLCRILLRRRSFDETAFPAEPPRTNWLPHKMTSKRCPHVTRVHWKFKCCKDVASSSPLN